MIPAEISVAAYSRRDRGAAAVILIMSAFAVCTLASFTSLFIRSSPPAGIVMNEDRFAQARAALPPRGTVGYLSDTGGNFDRVTGDPRDYYLTQYYLAPVVVAPAADHELVIANCTSSAAMAGLADVNHLTVERDFSNGVAILRRRR